jgi:hypothetical protein
MSLQAKEEGESDPDRSRHRGSVGAESSPSIQEKYGSKTKNVAVFYVCKVGADTMLTRLSCSNRSSSRPGAGYFAIILGHCCIQLIRPGRATKFACQ